MQVLIIGGDSLIGKTLKTCWLNEGASVVATSRRKDHQYYLDLNNPLSFEWLQTMLFDLVYCCAGITSIKDCQRSPKLARLINVWAYQQLLPRLSEAKIVWFSTSHVFSEVELNSSSIKLVKKPRSVYGELKCEMDQFISQNFGTYCVVRMTKVMESLLPLLQLWRSKAKEGKSINAFVDHYICPVSMTFVIKQLTRFHLPEYQGVIHIYGERNLSYAQLAEYLFPNSPIDAVPAANAGVKADSKGTLLDDVADINIIEQPFSDTMNIVKNHLDKFHC